MKRKNAIDYLERKGKIEGNTTYSEEEEEEIKEVIKHGKIYGDPIFEEF